MKEDGSRWNYGGEIFCKLSFDYLSLRLGFFLSKETNQLHHPWLRLWLQHNVMTTDIVLRIARLCRLRTTLDIYFDQLLEDYLADV